jgi:hypothetical protein
MKEKVIDNKKDLLLLFLYSDGVTDKINEPINGRTRLAKLLFVFKNEGLEHFKKDTLIDENNFYKFFPWNFGPFSTEIYDDLVFFHLRGFIEFKSSIWDGNDIAREELSYWDQITGAEFANDYVINDYVEEEISLTEIGLEYTKPLFSTLTKSQKNILKSFKKRFNSAHLRSIIMYVYKQYPDFAKNSLIRENILGQSNGKS